MTKKEIVMNAVRPVNFPLTKFILKRHYQGEMVPKRNEQVKKVLVLAPHMDDETIGPGGTLRQHADQGAEVHCLFITDGSSSVSDRSMEDLKEKRRQEIDIVTGILGLSHVSYLNVPDGKVGSDEASIQYLKEKIRSFKPELIYTTPFIDAHPDHTATVKLLSDTLQEMEESVSPTIRLYEINCAFPPSAINCLVDTTTQHDQKVEATTVFDSQAIAFDGFLELNYLKGNLALQSVKAAEGFIELDRKKFTDHCESLARMDYDFPSLFKQVNRTDTLLWAIFKNYALKKDLYRKTLHTR